MSYSDEAKEHSGVASRNNRFRVAWWCRMSELKEVESSGARENARQSSEGLVTHSKYKPFVSFSSSCFTSVLSPFGN